MADDFALSACAPISLPLLSDNAPQVFPLLQNLPSHVLKPSVTQPVPLPRLSPSMPTSNPGSPPLCCVRCTEQLIVCMLDRQCFY